MVICGKSTAKQGSAPQRSHGLIVLNRILGRYPDSESRGLLPAADRQSSNVQATSPLGTRRPEAQTAYVDEALALGPLVRI